MERYRRIWLNSPQYQTLTLFIQILPFFCEFFVYVAPADYLTGMYDEQIRSVMAHGEKQTSTYSGSKYTSLPTNINVTWIDEEGRFYEVSKTVVEAPAE